MTKKEREWIEMTANRLEVAMQDDPVCKHCVELAHSYLLEALQRIPQEGGGLGHE